MHWSLMHTHLFTHIHAHAYKHSVCFLFLPPVCQVRLLLMSRACWYT